MYAWRCWFMYLLIHTLVWSLLWYLALCNEMVQIDLTRFLQRVESSLPLNLLLQACCLLLWGVTASAQCNHGAHIKGSQHWRASMLYQELWKALRWNDLVNLSLLSLSPQWASLPIISELWLKQLASWKLCTSWITCHEPHSNIHTNCIISTCNIWALWNANGLLLVQSDLAETETIGNEGMMHIHCPWVALSIKPRTMSDCFSSPWKSKKGLQLLLLLPHHCTLHSLLDRSAGFS